MPDNFDPDKYLSSGGGFNPDEYLKPKRESMSPAYSAGAGFSQGATLGFGDEISGLANAGYDAAKNAILGDDKKPFIQRYREWRDLSRRMNAMAEKDNPKTYIGGNIAGAVASPVNKVLAPVKGAGLLMNASKVAGAGALAGAGNSSADATQSPEGVKDLLKDTAVGAGTNLAITGALAPVGYMAGKLAPENLAQSAEQRAVKAAIGQNKKAYKDLVSTGQLQKTGRDLLEEPGVIGWASNAEDILPKAQAAQSKYGQQIGKVAESVDKSVPDAVSGKNIGMDMLTTLEGIPDTPKNQAVRSALQKEAGFYINKGDMPFNKAQEFKGSYVFKPTDTTTQTLGQDVTNSARKAVSDEMENAAERIAKDPNVSQETKDLLGQYKGLKSKYGSFKTAADLGQNKVNSDLSNRFVSPSDYGTALAIGAGRTAAGDPSAIPKALAGGFVNKQLRERGSAFAARSMDKLADIMRSNPAGLNQFRGVLESAASRGPQSLAITHQLLSDNPEYRKLLQEEGQ